MESHPGYYIRQTKTTIEIFFVGDIFSETSKHYCTLLTFNSIPDAQECLRQYEELLGSKRVYTQKNKRIPYNKRIIASSAAIGALAGIGIGFFAKPLLSILATFLGAGIGAGISFLGYYKKNQDQEQYLNDLAERNSLLQKAFTNAYKYHAVFDRTALERALNVTYRHYDPRRRGP